MKWVGNFVENLGIGWKLVFSAKKVYTKYVFLASLDDVDISKWKNIDGVRAPSHSSQYIMDILYTVKNMNIYFLRGSFFRSLSDRFFERSFFRSWYSKFWKDRFFQKMIYSF